MAFEHPLLQAGFLETLSSRFDCPHDFSVTEETLTPSAQDGLLFHEGFPYSVQGYRHHAGLLGFW